MKALLVFDLLGNMSDIKQLRQALVGVSWRNKWSGFASKVNSQSF